MILSKAQILAAPLKTEAVEVPEWGGTVLIREFSGETRSLLEGWANGGVDKTTLRERIAAISIVDESGSLMFSDEDVRALAARSAAALERVGQAAMKLNKLSDKDVEAEKGN